METPTNAATLTSAPKIERLVFNSVELRTALGISRTTMWRLIRAGHLHPLPGNRRLHFSIADVNRYLASARQEAA